MKWWAAFFWIVSVAMTAVDAATSDCVDWNATAKTRALYENLKRIPDDRVLFGHQHTTCYGVGWTNDDFRSDVKDVTGSFPAVYGWDWGHLGTDHLDKLIIDAFERGGVNTLCWHMPNPVTGGTTWDNSPGTVSKILPGGECHPEFVQELDQLALFFKTLRTADGELVPVIFRPWHEHTGNWFWWGAASCTSEEYIALWRFTVKYFRDEKQVHNLLWAYSPSSTGVYSDPDYETNRFPGYDWIDILGIDVYTQDDTSEIIQQCARVARLAKKHKKVAALTEFGYVDGLSYCTNANWYTTGILEPLKKNSDAGGIAYLQAWRNGAADHFWVPYSGHRGAADFQKFFEDPMTIFENNLPDMYAPESDKAFVK